MQTADLHLGMRVRVVAADDFYAYINGWIGTFHGFTSGYPTVVCKHVDGIPKTFLVPADQLEPAPLMAGDINGNQA